MRSYRPEELFDDARRRSSPSWRDAGAARRAPHEREPARERRPAAARPRPARLPRLRRRGPGAGRRRTSEATRVLGEFLRDVIARNPETFRLFGPDETASNRLGAVFEATARAWEAEIARRPTTDLAPARAACMEVLSEHQCQGWLEGYLLTGRHGLFNCYEAFIHIVDSMFNQHAKWLKVTRGDPVAPADRVAQLPAHLARLAAGPQRLLAPGPRVHRPRREQEGRGHPRLPAARREHAALRRRPLPAQPRLRQRHRRGQAAGAELPLDGRGDRALHARRRHLGVGVERRGRRARRRARVLRRRARRSRRSRPRRSCASTSPT